MSCRDCNYYVPHAIYRYIGFCEKEQRVVVGEEYRKCGYFQRSPDSAIREAIEARGWIYCADCYMPIYDYETALQHKAMGHLLTTKFMFDRVAAEESPGVD